MKTYDVECPVCGQVNKNLYMEETNGWMECEKCHILSHHPEYCGNTRIVRISVYTIEDLKGETQAEGA